ncbi:MAG: hypothetical protein NWQ28_13210, partial [Nodularia sp. (in: cyanobacteria)]|nr:hypothetical protein [Nodularia sp. (in: cyanobacteria)]
MNNSQCFHPNFEQFYHKISPEVKKTLTHEQIQALKIACEAHNHNRHFLNIRVSFPILRSKFYMVVLAGKERRSQQRLHYKKGIYPLRNPINILLLLG